MRANKDPNIIIKETDSKFYHVEFTKIVPDGNSKRTKDLKTIQLYDRKSFKRTFSDKDSAVNRLGIACTGFDEVRIVHDPVLQEELEHKAEQERIEKEKAEAEKKTQDDRKTVVTKKTTGRKKSE